MEWNAAEAEVNPQGRAGDKKHVRRNLYEMGFRAAPQFFVESLEPSWGASTATWKRHSLYDSMRCEHNGNYEF